MYNYLICLFLFAFKTQDQCTVGTQRVETKRILLSDPDVIQRNFLAMEEKIQNLTAVLMTRLPAAEKEIQSLKSENTALKQTLNSLSAQTKNGGAVYVRWGRKTCPDNETEQIYSGFTGGSTFDQYGSTAEYVCLPPDPLWNDHTDTTVNRNGRMFGAEYETGYFGNYHTGLDDVPCVVCRSRFRQTVLMLPGRNKCYSDWKQEYFGNLASGAISHKAASQFICVDKNPEVLTHGTNNDNGKLLYAVEGICGSLPCPPYENGKELSCVVCTK